jgi:hypothetical protein
MNIYRRSSKPQPPPPIDTSDIDDYMTLIAQRNARWKAVRDWAWIFGVGVLVVGGIIVILGLFIQQQERKAECERRGYTWIETEYSAKCIAVKEIK